MGNSIREDQAAIERATTWLRHETAMDQYRGQQHPAKGFALALLLDEIRLHLRTLDDDLRSTVVEQCAAITGDER